MNIFDIIMISVALAMDCFTVSIVAGVILRRWQWRVVLRMSTLFGLFQALMPLGGWLCTRRFAQYIEAYDHWMAFGLLVFLGVNMIREAYRPEEEHHFNPTKLRTQLILAVATSIDALAVGISFAMTGYSTLSRLTLPLVSIGAVSLLFGMTGQLLGVRYGAAIRRRLRPELLGGIILIIIGFKVLATHLFGLDMM